MTHHTSPTVLISPAMAVPSRYYRPVVDAFARREWFAATIPRRGLDPGTDAPSRSEDWSYADEADDLSAAVRRVRAQTPGAPVMILGHSLGAQLCAVIGQRGGEGAPDAIATVAASVPYFRHYARGGVVEWCTAAAVPIVTAAVGHWPTPGFGAPAPRTLMREWARMVRTGVTPFDGGDPIEIPTLAVRLADDRLVPARAAERFERAFHPAARTTWTYSADDCPPGGSVGHVRWARTPDAVVDRIVDWWTSQLGEDVTRRRPRRNVSITATTTPSTAKPIIDA
ncbi:alpha/beta hydrolase [Gordonia hankookensis]|uniref:Alpha/beta hydrolase n=2 Tax=Gordonia hankookensis TaxID=589403 RepID=A0ABR7WHN8_9ACTN|nr:alpha/beta hydrolase [Gordonia hankookensis]